MRWMTAFAVVASGWAGAAAAADKPVIAPAPGWIKPVAAPSAPAKPDGAAVRVLLLDQQYLLRPQRQERYQESVLAIQTPQGLAAGNISLPWRPETDTLTIHKLIIRRGGEVIDVLKSGQTFTVLRRETNLESATLDGVLTANIQPEGLQVGDIVDLAVSIATIDPVLAGHVEGLGAGVNATPIDRMHFAARWPATLAMRPRVSGDLPPLKTISDGATTGVDLSLDHVQPLVLPKGAPARFRIGRLVELTDFGGWSNLAALMAPLYVKAATLRPASPLNGEIARLKALADAKARAEGALALVQDRVRYVALAMGAGGLVPADADTTWSRRYGDCKGKTALLLALLHALDIQAEPVVVNALGGDGLDQRLPMIELFNHVLVRATIGGRAYWLDGTRSGDTHLDTIRTPDLGWGLPLAASGATLVRIVPPPLDAPMEEAAVRLDARGGLAAPAPAHIEVTMRGDLAVAANLGLANLAPDARDRALRDWWKTRYDFIEAKTTAASFDAAKGEERLVLDGDARMDWSHGGYEVDGARIGYHADFHRDAGPDRDAPFAVAYPLFTRDTETILLPPSFAAAHGGSGTDLDRTIAGIEYHRHSSLTAGVFTIEKTEKSVAPEFPAKDAPAAEAALRELADNPVWLMNPARGVTTVAGALAALTAAPTTAQQFVERGALLMRQRRYDDSIADFSRAVALDKTNAWALANRGLAHAWKRELDAADKDVAAAMALDGRNPVALRARGLVAQLRDAPAQAIAAYTASLEIEPDNAFALGERATLYKATGDADRALADAAAALRGDPHWIDLYLLRANILRNQGKPEAALGEMQAALAANPGNALAHVAAGRMFAALGHRPEAMAEFDRALAIKPEAYIYLNRSESRTADDVAGRRADLDAALRLEPTSSDALAAKAQLLDRAGDAKGATAAWSSALAAQPGAPGLLIARGVARLKAGDAARAEADFAAARAKGATPALLNSICWDKATAGVALESALADCEAALAKEPDNPTILDSRAFVELRLGRLDAAIADYDRALAKRPAQAASLFGRAVAWTRKGDKAKGDADAAAALKGDADIEAQFRRYGVTR